MTAHEIQNSVINNSSAFQVTLTNGNVVEFRADLPESNFFTFHFDSNTLSAYKCYDSKGLQNRHIVLKGGDIASIKILGTSDQLRKHTDKVDNTMTIVVVIVLLIGFLVFISKHWH
jgi:hypothetical protein